MPDPNKLEALANRGYKIAETCGTCIHGSFIDGRDWGLCRKISYQHQKHNGTKNVSIHVSGCCPQFQLSPATEADLQRSGFDRFVIRS